MPPQWKQLRLTDFCFRFNTRQPCAARHGRASASAEPSSQPITVSSDSPQRMSSSVEGIQLCASRCTVCKVLWSLLDSADRAEFQSTAFFIHSDIRWYTAAKPSIAQSPAASEQAESETVTSDHSIEPSEAGSIIRNTALYSEDDTVYHHLPRKAG